MKSNCLLGIKSANFVDGIIVAGCILTVVMACNLASTSGVRLDLQPTGSDSANAVASAKSTVRGPTSGGNERDERRLDTSSLDLSEPLPGGADTSDTHSFPSFTPPVRWFQWWLGISE